MSAWNTETGGETFAEIVKHSVEGEDSTEEVSAPSAPVAAPVEISEESFPELPHVEETTPSANETSDDDASLLAASKGIDDALAASRAKSTSAPAAVEVEDSSPKAKTPVVEQSAIDEQEEHAAFDPSDVLAFSLATAFSPPPPPPSAAPPSPRGNGTITPLPSAALPDVSAPSPSTSLAVSPPINIGGSPDPTLVDPDAWKEELDARTRKWKTENKVARDKAEKTRAEWEQKREEERQAEALKKKEKKVESVANGTVEKRKKVAIEKGIVEKELGLEEGAVGLEVKGAVEGEDEVRWSKVGKAWEGVGKAEEVRENGVPKVEDGQIVETFTDVTINSESEPIATTSSSSDQASKSLETTPPPDLDSPSAAGDLPITHYLTTPGGTPPSLTLALFTSQYLPPRRRILLGLACFGINILLPFIGGMMAGFGEITAKLLQDAARDTWFGFRGRGVGGVGLGATLGKNGSPVPRTEVGREVAREALVENPMDGAFP